MTSTLIWNWVKLELRLKSKIFIIELEHGLYFCCLMKEEWNWRNNLDQNCKRRASLGISVADAEWCHFTSSSAAPEMRKCWRNLDPRWKVHRLWKLKFCWFFPQSVFLLFKWSTKWVVMLFIILNVPLAWFMKYWKGIPWETFPEVMRHSYLHVRGKHNSQNTFLF